MTVVPKNKPARISFFNARVAPWGTNSAVLKLDAADVTLLGTKVSAAQSAHADFVAAQAAARSATINYDQAVEDMTTLGMQLIDRIRATARTAGDGIYALADLPIPAIPSPIGAPGKPYGFEAVLLPDGTLEFTWACDNPPRASGTVYTVWRKKDDGTWQSLGGAGQKKFIDTTVPAGVPSVIYSVQAMRSTGVGVSNEFTVNFGVASGGGMTATVSAPKLAA